MNKTMLALAIGLLTISAGEPCLHKDGATTLVSRAEAAMSSKLGDLLSQAREYGGAGLGTIYTSLGFLAFIIVLVAWVTFEGKPAKPAPMR